jgi:hypothetical protein
MSYHDFLEDLGKWMDASNVMVNKYPLDSDQYWEWAVNTIGILCDKHGNSPLYCILASDILKYQEDNYKQLVGR